MGSYLPLVLGASWTYQNQAEPYDIVVDSVFEQFEYEGRPALRFGTDLQDHSIVWREAGVVYLYAVVEEGILYDLDEDVVLDEVIDGGYFSPCFGAVCDSSLIRIWIEIDPTLRTLYGVDPELTDLLLWASYDPDFPPNLHNIILESGLPDGVDPPAGAVTGIDLYQRSVGLIESWDVEAATGGLSEHYVLNAVSGVDLDPTPPDQLARVAVSPNPFNPRTTISYTSIAGMATRVAILDMSGRRIRTLVDEPARATGRQVVDWDGREEGGRPVASGVYFCRVLAAGQAETRLITLLR